MQYAKIRIIVDMAKINNTCYTHYGILFTVLDEGRTDGNTCEAMKKRECPTFGHSHYTKYIVASRD